MKIVLQQLNTISPSQYGKMSQCPYQILLEQSNEGKALKIQSGRGPSGMGALGTIIHRVLEAANRKGIPDEIGFEAEWQHWLKIEEAKLMRRQCNHLIPLAFNARNYAVRKLLLFWLVVGKKPLFSERENTGLPVGPEKRLIDRTGQVNGTADLIRFGPGGGLEVVDYKTGQIMVPTIGEFEELEIKEEYALQLRLYAALLYEQAGEWPESLLLADLAGGEHLITYKKSDCMTLLQEARAMLREINIAIENGQAKELAQPSAKVCSRCRVKELCEPYFE